MTRDGELTPVQARVVTVEAVTRPGARPVRAEVTVDRPRAVGRSRTADVVVDDERVSRHHLQVEVVGATLRVTDVSSNGSWLDGARLPAGGVTLAPGGVLLLQLGAADGPQLRITDRSAPPAPAGDATVLPDRPHSVPRASVPAGSSEHTRLEQPARASHPLFAGRVTLGRGADNDVDLPDLLVSRHHAEVHSGPSGAEIVDLGSANGTFVNGRRIERSALYQGDVVALGHFLLQVDGPSLVEFVDSGDVSFEADDLSVFAGEKQLMHDVGFRLPARTLLAVVGPSGAGKSTLLGALTGFRPADRGTVRYAGRDLYTEYDELRRRIGYVPQDDLLHTSLSVRKALDYGAELRFPPDVTAAERRARVDEVMATLGLTQHAGTTVSRLSGGQRKRTSVALELLTRPSLLYLDEPTSGLDPGLDKSVMHTLRELADDGRTVIVVTHSVANLDVCDAVLVLAPGGHVAYLGPSSGALDYFGETDWADVFLALEAEPGAEWGRRFRASDRYVPAAVGAPSARRASEDLPDMRQQSVPAQLSTLVRRYLSVVVSDRSYLRLIIAFPLLLGIIPRVIPAKYGLSVLPEQPNRDAPTVLLVLILCACFMGMANSVREVVKERTIYRRERAIGLSLTAYLGSKVIVLALLTAPQAVVFTLIGVLGRTPGRSAVLGSSLVETLVALVVTALVSVLLGLVVSTLVNSADKTMPLLVLITMAQLVLSGGLIPVAGKAGLEQVAWFSPARWGYAAVSSSIDMNAVLKTDQPAFKTGPPDPLWDPTAATYLTDIGLGLVLGLVCIVLCAWLLRRGDPKPRRLR